MKKSVFFFFVISSLSNLLYLMPSFGQPVKEVTVSAAISLKDAFEEIGKVFEEKHPGQK